MNGTEIQVLAELYAPAEQLLGSMPLPMEGCGTLLYESFQALLPVVLFVGLAAIASLMIWRYRSLLFAIGKNAPGNPVSALGHARNPREILTRSA